MIEIDDENIDSIPKKKYNIKKLSTAENPKNQEEEDIVKGIKKYFEKNLYIWDTANSNKFQFTLPSTMFTEERKIDFKKFKEAAVSYDEGYISRALTNEQLEEIWKTGHFQVKSKIQGKPYIWKLSEWLHQGRKSINTSLCRDFGQCFYFLWILRDRFSFRRDKYFANIVYSFKAIQVALKELWGIFFGRVRYNLKYTCALKSPDAYLYPIVLKNYFTQLLKDHPEIVTSIYQPQFQNIIKKIEADFELKWADEKKQVETTLREQDLNAKEIKQKLSDIRFTKYIEEFQNSMLIDNKKKSSLIDFLKADRIYSKIQFDYAQKCQEIKEEFLKENPIRSTVSQWVDEKLPEIIIQKQLEEEVTKKIENELDSYPIQKMLIKSWQNFNTCKKQLIDSALEEKKKHHVLFLRRNILPPYEVAFTETKDYKTYYLKTFQMIEVATDFSFWRLKILLCTIYILWVHCLNFGYYMCWNWGFGLKALWSKEIITEYSIDSLTGVISPSNKSFTYHSVITSLFKSISESRNDFEKTADMGFLGGKTGRLFNFIENYIIKLIFGGIVAIIMYPIFILLLSSFFFILMLLGLIFVPLGAFEQYLLNILLFDYNAPGSGNTCLPIFQIIFQRLLGEFVLNLFLSLIVIIGQILISVILFFGYIIRWTIRSLYDYFTYLLIKCNGTIPIANTSFAWRIAGPGISRTIFTQLEIKDALIFITATLEKMQLQQFQKKIQTQLDHPIQLHTSLVTSTLHNVNGSLNPNTHLQASIDTYKRILSKQVSDRYRVYPYLSSQVRFTQNDLEILLEATHELVKEFVKRNYMEDVWKLNGLMENNWRGLTEKVMISAFNSEDVLINVDESELVRDTNVLPENIYEDFGIHKTMEKAKAKRNLVSTLTASLLEDNEYEYYHSTKLPRQYSHAKTDEIQNAVIAPETTISCLFKIYNNINLGEKCTKKNRGKNKQNDT